MTNAPTLAPSSLPVLLDFGCGNTPREGFEGVDLHGDKAVHRVDLFKFPFPWADNSVDEIHASHFIEHIPAREVEQRDVHSRSWTRQLDAGDGTERECVGTLYDEKGCEYIGKDMLLTFFDECYRILKPSGWIHIIVPCLRSDRAFQDPTHRRFINEAMFWYLNADWRKFNVPQYPVKCNFEMLPTSVSTTTGADLGLRIPEVQGAMIRERWNVGIDVVAKLRAIK